ncbi:cytochrome P450 [Phanerochaete sordida]|uniref:Cytochrome P450 n=1 Tax=Phanerochaete sordida TaxID=48140 RepID=A0A9P3G002_9APHY|nr:cytochrome P450 [Phanerochaete sordida]
MGFSEFFFAGLLAWFFYQATWGKKTALSDVAGPPRESWLRGNTQRLFRDALDYNLWLSRTYGAAVKMCTLFGREALYLSDPLALHHVFVKDQQAFDANDAFIQSNLLLFGEGLIGTLGEQHRKQRKMLNPVFSVSNLREILPIIHPIATEMASVFTKQIPTDGTPTEIDVMPWLSRGAQEYISQACFGWTFNALDLNKRNTYSEAARRYTPAALRVSWLRPYVPFIVRAIPLSIRTMLLDWYPGEDMKDFVYILDIMHQTSKHIFEEKKKSLEGDSAEKDSVATPGRSEGDLGPVMQGKDIMSILLKANASSDKADRMTDSEIISQMSTLLFAGFETTTYAVSRILCVLASHPEAQARIRTEVKAAKEKYLAEGRSSAATWQDVSLSYDDLMALPYLDAVIRETLRVYPPSSVHFRVALQDTTLPLQYPVKSIDGKPITSIPVEKGTQILVSIIASNHNKDIWGADASEWKPERWLKTADQTTSKELTDSVKYPGVYNGMMTFLGGPRACIGFKFSEMEAKQVLATLLPRLHFAPPSAVDERGNKKEVYWMMSGPQIPVVRPPFGDGTTAQVPLDVRLARDEDFAETSDDEDLIRL